jgi:D-alanine-D-alanine ligase
VRPKVAIIYNDPGSCRYEALGEEKAVVGVLKEVDAVYGSLTSLGYAVVRVPLLPPVERVADKLKSIQADVIFNLCEGIDGYPETEADVANTLAGMGIPFTGCPGSALALALDKARTKELLQNSGICTPRYQLLSPDTLNIFHLTYPCIVKPLGEDASHGISEDSVVTDSVSLKKQVTRVSHLYRGMALVEEFVGGREFNVTVMGNRELTSLPISEIAYSLPPGMPKILTYSAKWEPQSAYFRHTRAICPTEIDPEMRKRIDKTARSVFYLLGCSGYARMDFRLNGGGELNVIDVNPNPDISPDSGAARQAKAHGMTYTQFIEAIVLFALERGE